MKRSFKKADNIKKARPEVAERMIRISSNADCPYYVPNVTNMDIDDSMMCVHDCEEGECCNGMGESCPLEVAPISMDAVEAMHDIWRKNPKARGGHIGGSFNKADVIELIFPNREWRKKDE